MRMRAAVVVALAVTFAAAGTVSPFSAAGAPAPATPGTIVDEWTAVKAPPAPALKAVTADPAATAFLVLDFMRQTCNVQVRPRCVASVPKTVALIARALAANMLVVYSVIPGGKLDDILPEVRPLPGQPLVTSGPDKFLGTDLEAILRGHGIKAVIVSGTAAHGAVLSTGSEAAMRGFNVYVPVDLMSAETTYAEQYTAWHLSHAPVFSPRVTLTRSDLLHF
ncbi:MAG TPA: cysteine hydrolase [bacterium]|nr:cysteine hydrolase [bacterium]